MIPNFNFNFQQEKLPTVKELWDSKSEGYKKWIFYFLGAIIFLFLLNIILVILLGIASANNRLSILPAEANVNSANNTNSNQNSDIIALPVISLFFIFISLVYFLVSIVHSFKAKTFIRLGATIGAWIIISDVLFVILFIRVLTQIVQNSQQLFTDSNFEVSLFFVFLIITIIWTSFTYAFLFRKINFIRYKFINSFNNEAFQEQMKAMQNNPENFANIFDLFNKQNNASNNPFVNPQGMNPNGQPKSTATHQSENSKEAEARKKVENLSIDDLYSLAEKLEISSYKTMPTKELMETIIKILASN